MQGHRRREKFFQLGNRIAAQSAAMGALPTLYAATSPLAANGDYYGPNGLFENRGYPKQVGLPRAARNVDTARRLWDISEQLTGVTYNALGAVP